MNKPQQNQYMPHPGSEEIYEVPEVNPTVSFNKETQRKVEAGEQY